MKKILLFTLCAFVLNIFSIDASNSAPRDKTLRQKITNAISKIKKKHKKKALGHGKSRKNKHIK
jgi:sensor domain CHASE-containing protein